MGVLGAFFFGDGTRAKEEGPMACGLGVLGTFVVPWASCPQISSSFPVRFHFAGKTLPRVHFTILLKGPALSVIL